MTDTQRGVGVGEKEKQTENERHRRRSAVEFTRPLSIGSMEARVGFAEVR